MTQIATVERILDHAHAEISVPRKSACGHDCEECAGCGVSGTAVHARARNPIGAKPGQKVIVQSDTGKMLKIVYFVYLVPVVLFFIGYLTTGFWEEPYRYTIAAAAFILGFVLAILYDRQLKRRGGLEFTITRLL